MAAASGTSAIEPRGRPCGRIAPRIDVIAESCEPGSHQSCGTRAMAWRYASGCSPQLTLRPRNVSSPRRPCRSRCRGTLALRRCFSSQPQRRSCDYTRYLRIPEPRLTNRSAVRQLLMSEFKKPGIASSFEMSCAQRRSRAASHAEHQPPAQPQASRSDEPAGTIREAEPIASEATAGNTPGARKKPRSTGCSSETGRQEAPGAPDLAGRLCRPHTHSTSDTATPIARTGLVGWCMWRPVRTLNAHEQPRRGSAY